MMTDLATRLRSVITTRLELARAATPGPWSYDGNPSAVVVADGSRSLFGAAYNHDWDQNAANARHVAANDPAFVIRACERDLRVLDRHSPNGAGECSGCLEPTGSTYSDEPICSRPRFDDCEEIRDLAAVYGEAVHP